MDTLSIIIYPGKSSIHLFKTIESIIDYTKREEIVEFVIVGRPADNAIDIKIPIRYVDVYNNIPDTFNRILGDLNSTHVVFICGDMKVLSDENWWKSEFDLYSIPEYELDTNLWSPRGKIVEGAEFTNFSLSKEFNGAKRSATCSDKVLAGRVEYIRSLDFRTDYDESFFTEISLRSCLLKAEKFHPFNRGIIACRSDQTGNNNDLLILEYFRKYKKLYSLITGNDIKVRVDKTRLSTRDFIDSNFDTRLFELHGSARDKKIAVVCFGASIDKIDSCWFNDFDVVIGVDYVGSFLKCDYCVTNRVDVFKSVMNSFDYEFGSMVSPYMLEDKTSGRLVINEHELSRRYSVSGRPSGIYPPFIDGSIESVALHFALFLEPSSVTLFGYDKEIKGDVSHTSMTPFYNDGKLWKNTEAVINLLRHREKEIDILKSIADSAGINIMRVTYA